MVTITKIANSIYDYPNPFASNSVSLYDLSTTAGLKASMNDLSTLQRPTPSGKSWIWVNNCTGIVPTGGSLLFFIVVGGGGGSSYNNSTGGGGGGLAYGYVLVKPGDTFQCFQGMGGTGGSSYPNGKYCGTNGGRSYIQKYNTTLKKWDDVAWAEGGKAGLSPSCNAAGSGAGGSAGYDSTFVIQKDPRFPCGSATGGNGGNYANGGDGPLCPINKVFYGGGGGGVNGKGGNGGGGDGGGGANVRNSSGSSQTGGGCGAESDTVNGWTRSGGSGMVLVVVNPCNDAAGINKNCSLSCPSNCNGNGDCDPVTGKCTCTAPNAGGQSCTVQALPCPSNCNGNGDCNSTTGTCTCTVPNTGGPSCTMQTLIATLTYTGSSTGINLLDDLKSRYPSWDGIAQVNLTVNISGNNYSTDPNTPALQTGTFPAKSTITINVAANAFITGAGGGGNQRGGDAISLGNDVTINNSGTISGGGGGGIDDYYNYKDCSNGSYPYFGYRGGMLVYCETWGNPCYAATFPCNDVYGWGPCRGGTVMRTGGTHGCRGAGGASINYSCSCLCYPGGQIGQPAPNLLGGAAGNAITKNGFAYNLNNKNRINGPIANK